MILRDPALISLPSVASSPNRLGNRFSPRNDEVTRNVVGREEISGQGPLGVHGINRSDTGTNRIC
jgi:hypothetical protein